MPIPLVTRILVADDHPIVRSGLKKVLDAQPDLAVVAEAEDGAEAVEKAMTEDVHVAILDVSMPNTTGIQAAEELHRRKPELRLLMLSMYDSEQFLFESLKAGASGYVLKSDADQDIVEAVRRTMRGQSFLYPSAISTLVKDYIERGRPDEEQFDILTPRELQVLKLIAEAHTSKEIAQQLVISIKTVERHRQNILDKLGMNDRVELTRYAIRRGLISLESLAEMGLSLVGDGAAARYRDALEPARLNENEQEVEDVTGPVICGIDDSSVATGATDVARDLARRFELPLLYVHVLDEHQNNGDGKQLLRDLAASAPAELAIENGHPADRLVAVARERQASFLVVGNHGPRSSLLGSISADVSRRACCPVVVVPPTAQAARPQLASSGPDVEGGIVRFSLGEAGRRVA